MKITIASLLPLASTTLAQLTATTSVAQVNADIVVLDDSVKALTAQTQAYNGDALQLGGITLGLAQVHLNTRHGGDDAARLPPQLNHTGVYAIINLVNSTLAQDNPRAVDVLKTKKPIFQQQGLDPFVKAGLQLLLSDHLYFSEQVLKRSPADAKPDAQSVVDVITAALQGGVDYFSN